MLEREIREKLFAALEERLRTDLRHLVGIKRVSMQIETISIHRYT